MMNHDRRRSFVQATLIVLTLQLSQSFTLTSHRLHSFRHFAEPHQARVPIFATPCPLLKPEEFALVRSQLAGNITLVPWMYQEVGKQGFLVDSFWNFLIESMPADTPYLNLSLSTLFEGFVRNPRLSAVACKLGLLRKAMNATAHSGVEGPRNTLHVMWGLAAFQKWCWRSGRLSYTGKTPTMASAWWSDLCSCLLQDSLVAAALEGVLEPEEDMTVGVDGNALEAVQAWRRVWGYSTVESAIAIARTGKLDAYSRQQRQRLFWAAVSVSMKAMPNFPTRSKAAAIAAATTSTAAAAAGSASDDDNEADVARGLRRLVALLCAARPSSTWELAESDLFPGKLDSEFSFPSFELLLGHLGRAPLPLVVLVRCTLSALSPLSPLMAEVPRVLLQASSSAPRKTSSVALWRVFHWLVSPRRVFPAIWRYLREMDLESPFRGLESIEQLVTKDETEEYRRMIGASEEQKIKQERYLMNDQAPTFISAGGTRLQLKTQTTAEGQQGSKATKKMIGPRERKGSKWALPAVLVSLCIHSAIVSRLPMCA
jgi:hypothetical protein